MGDVAAECGKLGRGECLCGRAVAPVNGVGQRVGRAGRVAGGDRQQVAGAFVGFGSAVQCQRWRNVIDRDDPVAGVGVGAVFVYQGDEDGVVAATFAAIGIDMLPRRVGCDLRRGKGLNVAVAPVDLVAGDGVLTGVGDGAELEGVGAAFIHVVRTAERDGGRNVQHAQVATAGTGPRSVFIDQVHIDGHVLRAVGINMADLAICRQICGGNHLLATITPTDDVLLHGVGTGVVDCTESQHIGTAFCNRSIAAQRDGRRDVLHRHLEAVRPLLAVVIHGDGGDVVCIAVGIRMADDETAQARGDEARRALTVAPVDRVAASGCTLIGGIVEADGLLEEVAFKHTDVAARVYRDHFGWRADGHGPGAGIGMHAIFINQGDGNRLRAERGVRVGQNSVGR